MNVLIIGGEGYIGRVLINFLIKKTDQDFLIKSLDLNLYKQNKFLKSITSKNYSFLNQDMGDKRAIKKALENIDAVVLLAGLVGDPITKKYPKESIYINEKNIKNVIDVCLKRKLKRLIFVSTCSNYGLISNNELANENHLLNPLSSYAKSKVKIEKYILSKKKYKNFHPTILRFSTAFGLSDRMRYDLTINEFTKDLFLKKSLLVYDPDTWRPYCHTKDFARLIYEVLRAPLSKISFQVFNAGSNKNNYTKRMLVNKIKKILPKSKISFQEHGSDPRNYRVDFSKVKSILKFETKFSIEYGIKEIIATLKKNKHNLNSKINRFGNYEIYYKDKN